MPRYLAIILFFILQTSNIYGNSYISSPLYEEIDSSHLTYGGVGLLMTPTARFLEDGNLSFGVSTVEPYNSIYATVQIFPWMEGVVRYTEIETLPYSGGNPQTYKDKGFDIKFKLFDESKYLPQLALGITDFGGSSLFATEYLVASKRVNNFDLSMGMGWGRLARRNQIVNPKSWFTDTYPRNIHGQKTAGKANLGRLFSGKKAGIFGGLEYKTPIPGLKLQLEYDTNDYQSEPGEQKYEVDSPLNLGIVYSRYMTERGQANFSLGYQRGNTIYANVSISSNLNKVGNEKFIAPAEIINVPYLEPYATLNNDWQKYLSDLIMWQMGNVGIVTHRLIFNDNELQVEISQGRFQKPVKAIDLASRILANNSPKNIDTITVINIDQGVETLRSTIPRVTLVESVINGPIDEELLEFNITDQLKADALIVNNENLYPNFYWEIKPHMLGTLQHQIKFYFWQLEALIHTEYSIKKGLYLTTDIGIDIANNYEDYTYHIPDGQLYHVRQDRRNYLTQGESGLRKMALDYVIDLHPNLKAKLSAGYLEWMYGGVGGEVLYQPDNKHWALGLDMYWVKQRDFDQKFSFQDYETLTGFLSFYRDIPFYDTRLKLSAGKFLAKDVGVHIDVSRRFKTGARVGGIVAFTDCDAACVGEGSFNKWIYFELPMDLFYTQSSTRSKTGYAWSPLTKDAGSKVETGGLYNLMMNATDEVDSLRLKSWSIKKIFSGFGTKPKHKG